jgi:hypothetical protein
MGRQHYLAGAVRASPQALLDEHPCYRTPCCGGFPMISSPAG